MAVTKTHPVKATLKSALEYICNPEKTDEKILISSFACGIETADIEFEFTRKLAKQKSPNLAHHLIQSFEPGETTPEQAHEIGMKLAEQVFDGKYEFVLTTHIDRGHIHNHLLYNSVSFVDYKHFHSTPKTYYFIRRTSDKLCKEYGLSVIIPNKNKGKSYIEHTAAKNGTSYKAKLKTVIDTLIPLAKDYDNFLKLMKQNGYEVKQGKYVSFRANEQERFTRSKTLGEDYTIEAITGRINKKIRARKLPKKNNRINLIIDIQNCIKAQESKGYEHWAKINNLKQASRTLNFLTEHNIITYEELENKVKSVHTHFTDISLQIKSVEKKINNTSILIKNIQTYSSLKPIYQKYKMAKDKSSFAEKYKSEIILFEAAYRELKGAKYPPIQNLKKSYADLTDEKAKLYEKYKNLKKQSAEIDVIKSNVDMIINRPKERETEIEK